jgi:hypothetical protein
MQKPSASQNQGRRVAPTTMSAAGFNPHSTAIYPNVSFDYAQGRLRRLSTLEELGFELLVALASLAGQALKLWDGTNRFQQGSDKEAWIAEETALDSMLQHVQGR